MTVRVVPVAQIAIFFAFVGKIKLTNDDQSMPSARHRHRALAVLTVEVDLQTRNRMHQNNRLDLLFAGPVDIGKPLENALIGHLELQLRDAITQATMHAVAEGQMLVDVVAHHVELVGVGEHGGVPVRRAVPHDHFFIFGDALSGDFSVFHRGAPHMHHG